MNCAVQEPTPATFWKERTGWSRLKELLFLKPLPGGSRWGASLGWLLLFLFLLEAFTGTLLALDYAPSAKSAWPSVRFIQEEVPFGAFIRALHYWGANAMVVLLLLHVMQVFVWGAYKRPREFIWMVGVLLMICTLALTHTGALLPWDQNAYWGTKVRLGIMGNTPAIGDGLRNLLQGGAHIGNRTLTRFFTFHAFLLPLLFLLLVVIHRVLSRLHGLTTPWWKSAAQLNAEKEPFWPGPALKRGIVILVVLVGLGVLSLFEPAPLEAQADPSQPFDARPEWYFMFLFQLRKYFEGPYEIVATFVLPMIASLGLFFWPFLDRNPNRDPRRRPVALALFGLGIIGLVSLTMLAIPNERATQVPRVAEVSVSSTEPAVPIQRSDVINLYTANCLACHGADGTGNQMRAKMPTITDFTSIAWQLSHTDLAITHLIERGNEPLMPAYRDKLAQQQILALVLHVRAFSMRPTEPAAPKLVERPPAPNTTQTVTGPKGPPKTRTVQPSPLSIASQMPADQMYREHCIACHDADGRGNTVRKAMPANPDFTDAKWHASRTNAEMRHSILEGKGDFMKPMKEKLSSTDAEQLVAFVRAFRDRKQVVTPSPAKPPVPVKPARIVDSKAALSPAPGSAKPGKKTPAGAGNTVAAKPRPADEGEKTRVAANLYRQYCVNCHGTDGKGREMRASMPTNPDFTSRTWQERQTTPLLIASILDGKGTLMPAFRGKLTEQQAQDLVKYVQAFGPEREKSSQRETEAASDFDQRFRELKEQADALRKQLEEEPPKPRKP